MCVILFHKAYTPSSILSHLPWPYPPSLRRSPPLGPATFSTPNLRHTPTTAAPFPAKSTTPPSHRKWTANASFFSGPSKNKRSSYAEAVKQELLDAIRPLDGGADATPEDQKLIDRITRKLEAVNPTAQPVKSDLLNGKWELIYTTSQPILQTLRPKVFRSRRNYQAINADTLRAQNMESAPFFNQVTADLTILNAKKVGVKFDYFKLGGLIPVKAPANAVGELEITSLDQELRVSRGDKGNLFVLKMVDPKYRIPS
ncbi:probable plastid-lipid-associated protein 4, chloroplastic [Salvia hispanica]|uniref:probable plastid-lipid-associated protein 4, chloroplastic n=1 Tax=Salvia hispanica TaxID=49212 RepID=UPI002009903E|nr:probable plastid-lipid-associated protein 4, chloroplastic [Salvia hispanica]